MSTPRDFFNKRMPYAKFDYKVTLGDDLDNGSDGWNTISNSSKWFTDVNEIPGLVFGYNEDSYCWQFPVGDYYCECWATHYKLDGTCLKLQVRRSGRVEAHRVDLLKGMNGWNTGVSNCALTFMAGDFTISEDHAGADMQIRLLQWSGASSVAGGFGKAMGSTMDAGSEVYRTVEFWKRGVSI